MFQRNILLPSSSSGSKNKPSKKQARKQVAATYFHTGFLLGLFFDPEDEGDMFL
jgi:hypothetical protein